ncbi:MAG: glycosyltransferase, partial [Coriobacteriia bacterium]|nr:glycosyltransferase [Coriobacteriia bacterium]
LVEAWSTSGKPLPLVVAGDTSHSDDYVRQVRQLDDDVLYAGYVYGARLAALYRHAALFVLPSELEGLPLTLLEALAYGTPVLASDIAPNMEILGQGGHYFSSGDVGQLARALKDLLPHLGSLKTATERARPSALREYDWDRICLETESLYRSVLSGA